jgi:hypothetical protein
MLISDRADIKPKLVRRAKESHCILIKRTIHQEDIILMLDVVAHTYNNNFSGGGNWRITA